jgi:peptidoglycan/LPS O-acetylase OafA/YrhL
LNDIPVHNSALEYRADIDGLRAVAVVSVLAFHAGVSRMRGGFVGVDVFFVISGYLISSIVFAEIAASRFSVLSFYQRRIRRILPALFGMLIPVTLFASVYFLPKELIDYAKSLLAASASASNFYFWLHSGYFDSPGSNPLLHTWSLAVEEQFYILFPLFLVAVRRLFPRHLRASVVVLFAASLLASALVVRHSQNAAFYMPYTRAWELLLGTLVSLKMFPRMRAALLRNLATLAGVALIAFSALFYSQATTFPGLSALAPCVGSALIIGAGESGSSLVGAVLSWRPIVFIGLISYSLYLWHWPVIVLRNMGIPLGWSMALPGRHAAATQIRFATAVNLFLSLLLGIFSWRYIERPFRSGPLRLSGKPLFALAGAVTSVAIAFSLVIVLTAGFPWRFSPQALQVASHLGTEADQKAMRSGTCFITTGSRFEDYRYDLCLRQDSRKKNYLLIGDSHSAALWPGLSAALPAANVMQASASNCRPFVRAQGPPECRKMITFMFEKYLPEHPVQGLFLEARFAPEDVNEIADTLAWAKSHDIPVVLFGPVPEYDAPLPRLLAYSIAWSKPDLPAQHRRSDPALLDSQLKHEAAAVWHVPYVSLYEAVCGNESCTEYADQAHTIPLMDDRDHLSVPGSLLVAHRLIDRGALPF